MLTSGRAAWVGFDAFDLVEALLTHLVLIIAGSQAGSLWHSQEFYAKAPGPKKWFIVEGASHVDDGDGVGKAMSELSPFFTSNLEYAHAGTNADRSSLVAMK